MKTIRRSLASSTASTGLVPPGATPVTGPVRVCGVTGLRVQPHADRQVRAGRNLASNVRLPLDDRRIPGLGQAVVNGGFSFVVMRAVGNE